MLNKKKKYIIYNKKIKFLYFIEKKLEVGISLLGWEVKSIKLGKLNIENSYIKFKNLNAYLLNFIIIPINNFNKNTKEEKRSIRLLLKKKELLFLFNKTKKYGYTIIPLCMYWKNNWIKLIICLSKGKKQYDKKKDIKEKEWKKIRNRILKTS
ncbi:MAG: SsrA-binding protein SmpB [Enterobacteriaceae bacterium PSmelAO3-2]|nr:SsrA-binding protein SmpB [Enterobacteriaceae bacterium Cmel17]WMC17524.1 MAG: SsrA-binding protein SmpB [Enterobacteriaceae bacterium Cmel21]WMC17731.1 MAG: SsrA-binding protein SmpB [Enterobacteriaceae bacterium PSmelAO3-2]WMC17935.1 MAG: SsrA-binding protein SmpB [Enterobacteriaceae bacterium PSmelAO3-1]WMC18137.1 MAG: SsrA-binding protein SmpB [Enterobacteriaceae bacterium PSmelAO1]